MVQDTSTITKPQNRKNENQKMIFNSNGARTEAVSEKVCDFMENKISLQITSTSVGVYLSHIVCVIFKVTVKF